MAVRPPRFTPAARRGPRQADADRGSSRQRGYSTVWDKAARAFRREHPLCQYCQAGAFGPVRASGATRVDHLYPQRRYAGVFWDAAWWVTSCDACDAAKQALEHQGRPALDALAVKMGRPILEGIGPVET